MGLVFLNVYKGCYGISISKMYTRVVMGFIFFNVYKGCFGISIKKCIEGLL